MKCNACCMATTIVEDFLVNSKTVYNMWHKATRRWLLKITGHPAAMQRLFAYALQLALHLSITYSFIYLSILCWCIADIMTYLSTSGSIPFPSVHQETWAGYSGACGWAARNVLGRGAKRDRQGIWTQPMCKGKKSPCSDGKHTETKHSIFQTPFITDGQLHFGWTKNLRMRGMLHKLWSWSPGGAGGAQNLAIALVRWSFLSPLCWHHFCMTNCVLATSS